LHYVHGDLDLKPADLNIDAVDLLNRTNQYTTFEDNQTRHSVVIVQTSFIFNDLDLWPADLNIDTISCLLNMTKLKAKFTAFFSFLRDTLYCDGQTDRLTKRQT